MTYFLHTGEVLFSKEPCTVTTILGSCVGVAIHDPVLRIGGLCHYLLPDSPANSPASTRYGDVALPYLIQRLLKAGSQKKDLRAWVSGGALLLEAHEIFFVGDRNADFAEKLLGDWGIRVVANDTRGFRGRKVVFHTHEGHFHCQALSTKAERALMVI